MDTPPKPPSPGKLPGAKALTGHKPATYIILGGGVLVGAWFIHKREASQPTDTTADDAANMGQDAAFAPTYGSDGGYYPGGTQGAVGSVDQTGAYGGANAPGGSGLIPLGNGLLWDPATGQVYGAIMPTDGYGDGGSVVLPNVPSAPGTGGGLPAGPGPNLPPVVTGQTPQPSSVSCPAAYPNPGPNPGSCYKTVCLKQADGHGHGKGKWHVYRDGTWKQVTTSC